MDDKQRLYERLSGMFLILDRIINEGVNFDFLSNLQAINELLIKLEEEGCCTHILNVDTILEHKNKNIVIN